MVVFVLYVKADLENVERIETSEHHRWCLNLRQSSGEEVREGVVVSDEETLDIPGSRGTAHLIMRFKGSKKECHINVLKDIKKLTREIKSEDSGEFVPLVGFDCKGVEPVAWFPQDGFTVYAANSSTKYENADFRDDWAEYDEDQQQSVGVYGIEYKFVPHHS